MLLIVIIVDTCHPVCHNAALGLRDSSLACDVIQHEVNMRLVADSCGESLVFGPSDALLFTEADRVEHRLHLFHQRDHVFRYLVPDLFGALPAALAKGHDPRRPVFLIEHGHQGLLARVQLRLVLVCSGRRLLLQSRVRRQVWLRWVLHRVCTSR